MRLSAVYNPFVVFLLRSPLHRLLSRSLMLVTVTGRKSHKPITLPVSYLRDGDTLFVMSSQERSWWHNLRGGAAMRVTLDGHEFTARGDVVENAASAALVLRAWVKCDPAYAKHLGIKLNQVGMPEWRDLSRAAAGRVVVRLRPQRATRPATTSREAPAAAR